MAYSRSAPAKRSNQYGQRRRSAKVLRQMSIERIAVRDTRARTRAR
jgi:hypothetical protein